MIGNGTRCSYRKHFRKHWKTIFFILFICCGLYAYLYERINTTKKNAFRKSNGTERDNYNGQLQKPEPGGPGFINDDNLSSVRGNIGISTSVVKSTDPVGKELKARFNMGHWNSSTVSREYHHHYQVNCSGIIQGDPLSLERSKSILTWTNVEGRTPMPSDEVVATWTRNCDYYRTNRKYPTEAMSLEEFDFPLAYILLVHKDAAQVERLLRSIYHPQNVYCFHVDANADDDFGTAILGMSRCFDNVFIASKLERVQYRGFSRLQADINCMEDLASWSGSRWKYVINLCGQDFPLKTNLEIVHQVKAYGSYNDIPGVYPKQTEWFVNRTRNHHRVVNGKLQITGIVKPPPPRNAKIYFGNAYYVASRRFVEFILNNRTAKELLYYLEDTNSPDEHYWVTMSRFPDAPGGYPYSSWRSSARFIRWTVSDEHPPCIGKYVRQVCVIGSGYLPYVTSLPHLFVNKLDYDYDPISLQCLEEILDYRTLFPNALADFFPVYPLYDLFPNNPQTEKQQY
nr:beta-1,3-galactosyl-O-glycosyl-glycoprotein beta-1,6-N-acetylglucosaminyltransferase-like [Lytechinus pictus]